MKQCSTKLVLVSGLPGSGKTTCGRWISKHYKLAYVDYDTVIQPFMTEIYDRFYKGRAYDEFCAVWRENCYQTFWDVIMENLKLGVSVAACAPLSKEAEELHFFSRLKEEYELDFAVLSLVLEVPKEILYTRIRKRNEWRDEQKLREWDQYYERQKKTIRWDSDIQMICHTDKEYKENERLQDFLGKERIVSGIQEEKV